MKIVYKKPILEQIHAAIHEAKKRGVEIDHFHLTEKEARELRKACGLPNNLDMSETGSIMGVPFVVEKFPKLDEIDSIVDSIAKHIFGVDATAQKKDTVTGTGCAGR